MKNQISNKINNNIHIFNKYGLENIIINIKDKLGKVNITNKKGQLEDICSNILLNNYGFIIKKGGIEVGKVLTNTYFVSKKQGELYLDAIESYKKGYGTKIIGELFKDNTIKTIRFQPLDDSLGFWNKLGARESIDGYILSKYEFLNYLSNGEIDKIFYSIYKNGGTKEGDKFVDEIESIDLIKI